MLERGKGHILNEYLVDMYLNPSGVSSTNKIKQVLAVNEVRKLLIQRIRYGRELQPPREFHHLDKWRWRVISWFFSAKLKIKNRLAGFLFSLFTYILSPSFFLHMYFWKRATKYINFKEYKSFVGPEVSSWLIKPIKRVVSCIGGNIREKRNFFILYFI